MRLICAPFRCVIVLAIGLLVMVSSCSKDPNDPGIIVDVSQTFELSLFEQVDTLQNRLYLQARTIENQECSNSTIEYSVERQAGKIIVSLNEILPPEDCQGNEGPASSDIPIGYLIPGAYEVEINLRNVVKNTGVLQVQPSYFYLEMNETAGLILDQDFLYRIPESTIWGYVAYNTTNLQGAANEFLAALDQITAPFNGPSGFYGHFTLGVNSGVELHATEYNTPYGHYLLRRMASTEVELVNLIESYRNSFPGLLIKIVSSQGLQY